VREVRVNITLHVKYFNVNDSSPCLELKPIILQRKREDNLSKRNVGRTKLNISLPSTANYVNLKHISRIEKPYYSFKLNSIALTPNSKGTS
jgi:hypothetical protein